MTEERHIRHFKCTGWPEYCGDPCYLTCDTVIRPHRCPFDLDEFADWVEMQVKIDLSRMCKVE